MKSLRFVLADPPFDATTVFVRLLGVDTITFFPVFCIRKDADPDPDIPIVKEARAEYAKLQ